MIFEFDQVESTNISALSLLDEGQRAPFLVRARAQRSGRGRGGKAWASPPGNFYGTFVLRAQCLAGEAAQLSFVAAVALASVLVEHGIRPQLKWPNDVLIGGAKLSGILLEMHGPYVLIGMGVNLAYHPNMPDYPSTCLQEQGLSLSPQALGQQLFLALNTWIAQWEAEGFMPIRAAWLARAYGLGEPIIAHLPGDKILKGRFEGLDFDGALLLHTQAGLSLIHAGDIFFHAAGD